MNSYLALTADRQRLLCEEAEPRTGLIPTSIEKDFWVCWTLRELFSLPEWGAQLTFKGGTALAKCWKLIERFSEDIDVVINRRFLGFDAEKLSNKQLNKLREVCSERIKTELKPLLGESIAKRIPATETWSLDVDKTDPDQQTLLFKYPSRFSREGSYIRPEVKIELGARSDTEPVESPDIQPILAETFPDKLTESTFSVRAVAARRTFWEKAMLLHEETYRPVEKTRKARMARHYYDLWCLINRGIARAAIEDAGLFERIAAHRQIFFRYSWMDYTTQARGRLRLLPLEDQIAYWRNDYAAMQTEMFYGEPPEFDEVLKKVKEFERGFNGS